MKVVAAIQITSNCAHLKQSIQNEEMSLPKDTYKKSVQNEWKPKWVINQMKVWNPSEM